jgi:hypothetical protein
MVRARVGRMKRHNRRELVTCRPLHRQALWWWLAAATAVAAVLRLYNLDVAGFWVDELYSIYAAADLSLMHTSKVLGYIPTWALLWVSGVNPWEIPTEGFDSSIWREMGITPTSARLGSALVGIISVPLIALASRRLLGSGGAVMVALLLATSPWHIYWSQAARFYSLQFLLYTLALIFYFRATRSASFGGSARGGRAARGSRVQFVVAMAFVVLAFLSQPTALSILALFGADWLIAQLRGRPLRLEAFHWLVGVGTVGVCAAVFVHDYLAAPEQWAQFVAFEGAAYQPPHQLGMGAVYMTGPAVIVTAIAAAWALRRSKPRLSIYLLLAALLPIGVFAVWSIGNAVGLRYLLICLYGWLALAAVGLDRIGWLIHRRMSSQVLALAPLAVVVVASSHLLLAYYTSAYGFHPRWPEAYSYVEARALPGDVISCRHPIVGRYYLQSPDVVHLPLGPEELEKLARESGSGRVWLVVESEGTSQRDIGPWIHEHTQLMESLELAVPRPISRVTVLLYEAR